MSEQQIEALTSRVVHLERIVEAILASPSMKLIGLRADGAPMIRCAIDQQPAPRVASPHATSVHPADQEIKDGGKLKAIAAGLVR